MYKYVEKYWAASFFSASLLCQRCAGLWTVGLGYPDGLPVSCECGSLPAARSPADSAVFPVWGEFSFLMCYSLKHPSLCLLPNRHLSHLLKKFRLLQKTDPKATVFKQPWLFAGHQPGDREALLLGPVLGCLEGRWA